MLTLEKLINMEIIWFSFSTSKLEIENNLNSYLKILLMKLNY